MSEHTEQPGTRKCRECQDETKLVECLWIKFHQKSKHRGEEHAEGWRQGPSLEVRGPNQENTATYKTAPSSQDPSLFESLSYQEGRDEHHPRCGIVETTGWSVPSLARCFILAPRAAETTYLLHRFPPKI